MPLGADGQAAYAPTTAVTAVIERYREVGFAGQPITKVTLEKVGVSASLIPRTLAALRLLDLIDEDGKPTDQFNVLKNAPGDDFRARLGEWLHATYAPIFGFCDPTTASPEQIEDAFRGYTPEGQRPRMANLFRGLLEYAGIIESAQPKPRGRHATKSAKAAKAAKARNGSDAVEDTSLGQGDQQDGESPREQAPMGGYRDRYVSMLIERAEQADDLDSDLLDRIERALGIAQTSGGSP